MPSAALVVPVMVGVLSLPRSGASTVILGALVSTVTVPLPVPSLPAGSVALTVMVLPPSLSGAIVLSAILQVPSPLFVAG